MSNPKRLIFITGTTGSGKSTVATKLAKQLDNCVNIEVDHVKHFIVSGFSFELQSDGTKKWNFDEWELVGDSIGLLANNFVKSGFDVIINGYLDESGWYAMQKHITLTHKIVLLPSLDVTIERDSRRDEEFAMGSDMVREHFTNFSESPLYSSFTKLDTSSQRVDETVEQLMMLFAHRK